MSTARRVALITGCGKRIGIGSSTARALANAGTAVVVSDIATSGVANQHEESDDADSVWGGLDALVEEIVAAGGVASSVQGDVSSEADAARMVEEVVRRYQRIDILVNNAGAPHGKDRADIEQVPFASWERVMAINVGGTFLMSRAAIPHMRAKKWGRIVNIASAAVNYKLAHMAAYTASKAAVVGFTQAVAMDVARSGITVNAVCPGAIATSRAISSTRHAGWKKVDEGLAQRAKGIPVGRNGTPDDIASMVAFLVSEQSSYITGQSIYVDGGSIAFPHIKDGTG